MLELGAFEQRLLIEKKHSSRLLLFLYEIWLENRQIMPGHLLLLPIYRLGVLLYAHILDLYVLDRHPFKQGGVSHCGLATYILKKVS
jgi:hypothetical protein